MANRSDNFNRADGNLGGSTPSDGGSPWAALGTTTGGAVSSNQYQPTSANSPAGAYLESNASDVDVKGKVAVPFAPTSFNRMSLGFRYSDDANHWYAEFRGDGTTADFTVTVYKRAAGSDTVVGGTSAVSGQVSASDDFRVHCVGAAITVYWTPVGTGVEQSIKSLTGQTFNQTATKHGFFGAFESTATRWDDFSITDLSAPPTQTDYGQAAAPGDGF